MHEALILLLLFGLGVVCAVINVMAGGGSTVVLPVLIFLGLESSLANGTLRVAIAVQSVAAMLAFRGENYREFRTSGRMALFTLPGAILGAIYATKIENALFERILGVILIVVIVAMIVPQRKLKALEAGASPALAWLIYPAMFAIGFYGGFMQLGVGFLIMAAIRHFLRLDLVRVNIHKVTIIFIYTIPALAIFAFSGNVNWRYGIVLACGNGLGGWWAAKISIRKGEKAIRIVLAIAIVIMSAKLLGLF